MLRVQLRLQSLQIALAWPFQAVAIPTMMNCNPLLPPLPPALYFLHLTRPGCLVPFFWAETSSRLPRRGDQR